MKINTSATHTQTLVESSFASNETKAAQTDVTERFQEDIIQLSTNGGQLGTVNTSGNTLTPTYGGRGQRPPE